MAKLVNEGYTGYFIRLSNDEKDSYNLTLGETVLANERDATEFVKTAGLKKWYDLSYRNHGLDDVSRMEMRVRLIFLFRLLKVDTVLSYDPWGHYEENPDHYVTAQAVEAACWMSGDHLDFPEQFEVGLKAHSVSEKYYFARGPQLVNRVVDIGPTLEQKVASIRSCKNMINNMVHGVNDSLAGEGGCVCRPSCRPIRSRRRMRLSRRRLLRGTKPWGRSTGWNMPRSFITLARTTRWTNTLRAMLCGFRAPLL